MYQCFIDGSINLWKMVLPLGIAHKQTCEFIFSEVWWKYTIHHSVKKKKKVHEVCSLLMHRSFPLQTSNCSDNKAVSTCSFFLVYEFFLSVCFFLWSLASSGLSYNTHQPDLCGHDKGHSHDCSTLPLSDRLRHEQCTIFVLAACRAWTAKCP